MSVDPVDRMLAAEGDGLVWELFHENSKTSMVERHAVYGAHPSDALVVQTMRSLRTVKQYTDRPKVPLPATWPASTRSFDEVLTARTSARGFGAGEVPLDRVAKGLLLAYGISRSNEGTHFPRPFRGVPSGGALYPLEVYLQAVRVEGLAPGLYHLDPEDRELDVLRTGDESEQVAAFMIQPELYRQAAATVFVSAVFVRSIFKYADRGYRFVLLEAGHLAQNMLLTWQEAGLAAVSIGGYLDRAADRHLRLDGLNESVVYALHVGPAADQDPAGP
jgi:SagB-type dehydrogenase family enzyme